MFTIIFLNFVSCSGASCLCHALRQFVHLAIHWFVTSITYTQHHNKISNTITIQHNALYVEHFFRKFIISLFFNDHIFYEITALQANIITIDYTLIITVKNSHRFFLVQILLGKTRGSKPIQSCKKACQKAKARSYMIYMIS